MWYSLHFVTLVSIFLGIFFLKLPMFIMFSIGISVVAFLVVFASRLRIDKIGIIVLINIFYWLGSGFAVGAIDLSDLIDTGFYDGEGRIFLSYVPVLLFAVIYTRPTELRLAVRLMAWLAMASLALWLVWMATHAAPLSMRSHFVGFLTSHTGAGTFFAFIAGFMIIFGRESRRPWLTALGAMTLLPVLATGSRQAVVSLFVAAMWYVFRKWSLGAAARICLLSTLVMFILPLAAPQTFERFDLLFTSELIENVVDQSQVSDWAPGEETPLVGWQHNILTRIMLWVYAVERFLDSPLVGIGFGRFNDFDLEMEGARGWIYLAMGGTKNFDTATAHNSYLHLLAESGIVGLALILWLWFAIWRRLMNAKAAPEQSDEVRSYLLACECLIPFVLTGALFGHALAAPSLGMLAHAVFGVGLACARQSANYAGAEPVRRPAPVGGTSGNPESPNRVASGY